MNFLKKLWNCWDEFFFAPTSAVPIGAYRALFGSLTLLMYSIRSVNWRFYFTDEGYLPASRALEILPEFYQPFVHWYPTTPSMAFAMQVVLIASLVCLTLGIFGRVTAAIAFVIHVALLQRNYTIGYGADFVATFGFFTLIFMDNSRSFSVMSWFRKGGARPQGEVSSIFSTMGLRMMQLQLCFIYAWTGMEKLKGGSWWDGTAVWSVIGNTQLMLFDLSWLKNFPMIVAGMTFATLLFEVYFAAAVWYRPIRKWVLVIGVGLHLGITFTIGLFFFSFLMMATYLLFLDERDYRFLSVSLR